MYLGFEVDAFAFGRRASSCNDDKYNIHVSNISIIFQNYKALTLYYIFEMLLEYIMFSQ
jgi:hypothetical protein